MNESGLLPPVPLFKKVRRGRSLWHHKLGPAHDHGCPALIPVITTKAHNVAYVEERACAWPG